MAARAVDVERRAEPAARRPPGRRRRSGGRPSRPLEAGHAARRAPVPARAGRPQPLPRAPSTPTRFGKICRPFMRSPQAHTVSTLLVAPEHDQAAVDPAVRHDDARAEHVLEELLAVVGPADQRRVAEQERRRRPRSSRPPRHGGVEGLGHDGGARRAPTFQTPLTRMVSALMEEVTNETMNTSITAFSPCCAGRVAARRAVGDRRRAVARPRSRRCRARGRSAWPPSRRPPPCRR